MQSRALLLKYLSECCSLVRFPIPARILLPLGRHPAERARAGLRARGLVEASLDFYQIVPSADLIFGILFPPTRKGACPGSPQHTDFPRRDGRACRDQLVGTPRRGVRAGRAVAPRPPPLRTWEASDGSLRNFTGMTREEDTALVQFHLPRCIIPGSLRRLIRCIGGGFRFPPRRCLERGASF